MHDDIPLTVGRATRVLAERILPAVHPRSEPLEVAAHALPGEPIPPADGLTLAYEPFDVGSAWGPAWGTTWFRLRGTVPPDWRGRHVEIVVDLGFDVNMPGFQAEALVYRPDGSPVKSINPRNQWIPVESDDIELYLEAASNPVLLDYHPFLPTREGDIETSSRRPLYQVRRMDLVVLDETTYELAADLDVLLEIQASLPETAPRRMRILQALDDALDVLDLQDIAGTAAAARAELAEVLASPAEASAHRISAIGHAHIDSAWLWPIRETIRKVARTASSMTSLMETEPDFKYAMSSAQQYAWLKEHRPEVWERVVKAVGEGRFVPVGGMWVESDTVMPTGEALVRQFTYGQRFFRDELGVECKGVWLPDSFGYSPAMPQLMRRAGFEWFFTQKISWNQVNKFPHHTFLWEGIDGSRVFTHFPPMDTYNSQLSGVELSKATRQFREARLATRSLAPVGFGDGGGGTTREMTGRARRLADFEGSPRVRWQHPDAFFAEAAAELPHPPVWVGELYLELHRATLTSQHKTKQGNRRSEHLLIEAELWAATAAVRAGAPYPYDELDDLWKRTLLHQFHDILPGTSIAWVHREAVAAHETIRAGAESIIAAATAALAGEGDREIVFNPAPFARHGIPAVGAGERLDMLTGHVDVLTASTVDGSAQSIHTSTRSAGGEAVPASGSPQRGIAGAGRLPESSTVPASGSTESGAAPASRSPESGIVPASRSSASGVMPAGESIEGGFVLSNELVSVTVSAEGLITSAVDLATGRDAIAAGQVANLLQLHQDFPNMWDAWDVDRFYRNRVTDLRDVDSIRVERDVDSIQVQRDVDSNRVEGLEGAGASSSAGDRIVIERSFSQSKVRQTLSLTPGSRTLRIEQETDWHETEKFLKVAFPFDVRAEQVAAETQFGYQKRVTHTNTSWEAAKFEASMHRFVHVEEPGFGASLVTDSTYGYDLTRDSDPVHGVTTTVRLSLLRAPRFPDPATDQGRQTCTYGLVIGSTIGDATEAGLDLNLAERIVPGDHGCDPLVSLSGAGLLLSSVKLADDRSGDIIVRLYESLGRRATGTLTVNVPIREAVTASLLEAELQDEVAVSGTEVPLSLSPFEVRTLRLTR